MSCAEIRIGLGRARLHSGCIGLSWLGTTTMTTSTTTTALLPFRLLVLLLLPLLFVLVCNWHCSDYQCDGVSLGWAVSGRAHDAAAGAFYYHQRQHKTNSSNCITRSRCSKAQYRTSRAKEFNALGKPHSNHFLCAFALCMEADPTLCSNENITFGYNKTALIHTVENEHITASALHRNQTNVGTITTTSKMRSKHLFCLW